MKVSAKFQAECIPCKLGTGEHAVFSAHLLDTKETHVGRKPWCNSLHVCTVVKVGKLTLRACTGTCGVVAALLMMNLLLSNS